VKVRRSACLLVTIPLLLLTLTASPVAASAYYAASFWFAAQGRCTMAFNPHMVDSEYSTWDYFERATGSFVFMGCARVTDQVQSTPWGDCYPAVDGTVKAYGWLKVSWSHGNEAYRLEVFIHSVPHTPAMIGPDPDIFNHGTTYVPPDRLLSLTGTLKRGSVVEPVQAWCGFLLVAGTENPLGKEIAVAGLHIYSLIDGKAVEFWWADSKFSVELPGDQTLVIPAARIFVHEVSVTPL